MAPATGTTPAAAAAAAGNPGEGCARSPSEVLVVGAEAALWATIDTAMSYCKYGSTWVLFLAILPLIFWLWGT